MTDATNGAGGADESGPGPDDRPTRASVAATYDRIAGRFAATRANPWPEVASFLAGRSGRVGLDAGCGNGRHAELLADRVEYVVGVDASGALLRIARDRAGAEGYAAAAHWVRGDAAALPVRDASVDLATYVATIHHLPTREGRVASLDDLARALAPGGRALVSAWSVLHDRFADRWDGTDPPAEGFDATVDWTRPDGERVPRFYHIYAPAEFEADLAASGCGVRETFVSSGNCYAVVDPGPDAGARAGPDPG